MPTRKFIEKNSMRILKFNGLYRNNLKIGQIHSFSQVVYEISISPYPYQFCWC